MRRKSSSFKLLRAYLENVSDLICSDTWESEVERGSEPIGSFLTADSCLSNLQLNQAVFELSQVKIINYRTKRSNK